MHKYYLLLRPVGPGCQPKGFTRFESYPTRTFIPEINRSAWSVIWYDRELTDKELADYDMMRGEPT